MQASVKSYQSQLSSLEDSLQRSSAATMTMTEKVASATADANAQVEQMKVSIAMFVDSMCCFHSS